MTHAALGENQLNDLLDRLDRLCEGIAGPDDLTCLEQLARTDDELCWSYICSSHLYAWLGCGSGGILFPDTESAKAKADVQNIGPLRDDTAGGELGRRVGMGQDGFVSFDVPEAELTPHPAKRDVIGVESLTAAPTQPDSSM